jgi:hypothetical protein
MHVTSWLVITFFVLSSGPAYGGWISLGGDENVGLTVYFDPATMTRKGDRTTMWILYDFMTPQTKEGGVSFRSATMQREYDCAKERTRLMEITNYADQMGNGQVVAQSKFDQPEWAPVGPLEYGTIAQDLWTLGCK